ncbi:DUF6198 family protein [uncultured Bacteroides sp.]|uniref:YczE/YyaS/YitT family protein n=1 Tax=uncultured Bacteroides sp. TaxID=162156 RepID=UPI00262D1892|nr:DUF6198 family protein [uncultured Bacteroides sp.]
MEKDSLLKRYFVFIVGLYFLALGIVLIVHSAMGTTPISSINYVLSLNTPLSLGTWTFLTNLIMIGIQLLLIRNGYGNRKDMVEILLQIPLSFVFSAFIDINMWLTRGLEPLNYGMSVGILLMGCIVQAMGVVLELKPKVAMMSAEGLVKYICRHCNKSFGAVKVYVDVTLVSLAILTSLAFTLRIEGVREGSVIAALITGYIVNFLNRKVMTRRMLYKLIPIRR